MQQLPQAITLSPVVCNASRHVPPAKEDVARNDQGDNEKDAARMREDFLMSGHSRGMRRMGRWGLKRCVIPKPRVLCGNSGHRI